VDGPLVCPSCGAPHDAEERFCRACGMPLVYASGEADLPKTGPLHERARKVRPQYAEGPLVRVTSARHQAEAEMIEGLLLEEGIPALIRRSRGFDVPDFLAGGPRDILVPASGAEAAREALGVSAPAPRPRSTVHGTPKWARGLAVLLAVVLVGLVVAGLVTALIAG
jgi:zinc-ribbon domain/Putative prokaryotic signal transducing protein